MVTFSHLPNELLLQIWAFVEPEDIRDFALVSRRIYQLSLPSIEHELFRKLFSDIRIRPGSNNGRAAELFRCMFQDPRAKSCMQDLETESQWEQSWFSQRFGTVESLQHAIVAFAGFLEEMPLESAFKGVNNEEEGRFLAFQLKRLIGWTEPDFSEVARGNCDLTQKLERLLFPSESVSHCGVGYWQHVKMHCITW